MGFPEPPQLKNFQLNILFDWYKYCFVGRRIAPMGRVCANEFTVNRAIKTKPNPRGRFSMGYPFIYSAPTL